MKTSNHLPIECRQEIEDKLLVVRKHWKDAGKFATDAFSGWLYALDWVLNNELSEPKESNERCHWQHAWGPMGFCLVCGARHPLKNPQTKLQPVSKEQIPEEYELEEEDEP